MTLTLSRYNAICGALPHATKVVQWHGCHVWKVGGKVFAIGAPKAQADETPCPVTIKVDESAAPFLLEEQGVAKEVHLPRGNWLRFSDEAAIDDESLKVYIERSYAPIAVKLTRKVKADLGIGA